jgi:alanyl-tRNA synthetase
MFINAGMNQFKDFFLGNKITPDKRIADTQKCLRVSGKHNDLEEVGRDSYHHTMFEMLGNWSFGDYFKDEAIAWAWELLTEVYGINPENLYVTVFGGDEAESLEADEDAKQLWKRFVSEDHIMYFGKKDNFWEMGEVGPCGPCSEIHIDLRTEEEKRKVPATELVNQDNPLVIELWNLVFIQFNRKADGTLQELPDKHIDTGMGFERLCMVLQHKTSNYDTDVFIPFINFLEQQSGIKYGYTYNEDHKSDIAMRVISDHLRAVSFTISDGALPSNTGAGYVIRRILRRAVRYYYSFLNIKEPLIHKMVPLLSDYFADVFPELKKQESFVQKVILEEEKSFLRALEAGLKRLAQIKVENNQIEGKIAFELYDTYGFPIDLTRLIASEKSYTIDEEGFEKALAKQKERSRADAKKSVGDWITISENKQSFVGYDQLKVEDVKVLKYRTDIVKDKEQYQLALDVTPFYAEGGGQVGDSGSIDFKGEEIKVLDTKKENELIVNFVDKLPSNIQQNAIATVNKKRRKLTENNHTATHLVHAALRQVLGNHVQQRGSLVNRDYLRFDFSHFQKMTDEEITEVETIVNQKIRENIKLQEDRSISIDNAKESGAMMLFGEKYGDNVRMITFDPSYSIELCGGCHVESTGRIGVFKFLSEGAIAAGIRRIEAVTSEKAEAYISKELNELKSIRELFKNPNQVVKNIQDLIDQNKTLQKDVDKLKAAQASDLKGDLISKVKTKNGVNLLVSKLPFSDNKVAKTLAYNIEKEIGNALVVFGLEKEGKPQLMVTISESLIEEKELHAGKIIKELAIEIQGGGGGQAFFATAGGSNAAGLDKALKKAEDLV